MLKKCSNSFKNAQHYKDYQTDCITETWVKDRDTIASALNEGKSAFFNRFKSYGIR